MKALTKATIDQLVADLKEAQQAYYTDGSSAMSDAEFDLKEKQLRELDPKNAYFKKVGAAASGKKIKHRVPMLSMQKANTFEEIQKWVAKTNWGKYGKLWLIEPKVDGNSLELKYAGGKLVHASTRGDGKEGQDITHIAKQIKDIPTTVKCKGEFEVRGELYLPKSFVNTSGKPLRNIVAGILNRKEVTAEVQHVRFVACRLLPISGLEEFVSELQALEWLQAYFLNVIPRKKAIVDATIQDWWEDHNEGKRHDYEFELDGLVIVVDNWKVQEIQPNSNDHHLDFNIAYKFSNELKRTTLRNITWQISRHGSLIPVANFDATNFGGTNVRNAGLSNAANVEAMKLMADDEIEVSRLNEIIPGVTRNLTVVENVKPRSQGSNLLPSTCPCCNTELEWKGVHLHCSNKECPEQEIQRIVHWVVTCEMEGVSEQTVRSLYEAGVINSIQSLYNLPDKTSELYNIEGFGGSKIDNLIYQIKKSRTMTIHEFVDRIGIPSVGEKAAKKLKIDHVQTLFNFKSDGSAVGDAVEKFMADSDNHNQVVVLSEALIIGQVVVKEGLRVCATGKAPMQRKDLIKLLETNGYVWADGVDKDLHMLLCDDPESGSTKNKKAAKLGIKVMTYDAFFASLK